MRKKDYQMSKKELSFITAILLIALILRLGSLFFSQMHDADFYSFLDRSSMILNGGMSFHDFVDPKPLWTYTLAAWLYFSGSNEFYASSLLILIDLLLIILVFFVGRDLFGRKGGYLACAFYALNPFTIFFCSAEGKMDMIPILFSLLSFWLLINKKYGLSSISLGIGIVYKYLAGLCLIPFLFFISKSENKKVVIKYLIGCTATSFIVALPFLMISPKEFIEDTLFFFMTRENTRYAFYHPYNFLPFYIPLIFMVLGQILIISYIFLIKDFWDRDQFKIAFFFIIVTNLLNRVLFTQYIMYAIPFLSLYFAECFIKKRKWLGMTTLSITFLLAFELLNNFGFTISGGMNIIGDMSAITFVWISFVTLFLFLNWNRELMRDKRIEIPNALKCIYGKFKIRKVE